MRILLAMPGRNTRALRQALRRELPHARIDEADTSGPVDFVIAWKHEHGTLAGHDRAKAIYSYGAGVDFLLDDPTLPDVPIGRVVSSRLGQQMSQYVLAHILPAALQLDVYQRLQHSRLWQPQAPKDTQALILGGGSIGGHVANALRMIGVPVTIWKRTNPDKDPRIVTSDDALERSLSHADFVVNTLPLTTTTKGILNGSLFQRMKSTACLINVGRGEHLVDDDLVAALDSGEIGSAALDVFTPEPLATESPLWGHPKIRITPHVASVTDADDAASILAGEFRALMEGKQPAYLIDKETQY